MEKAADAVSAIFFTGVLIFGFSSNFLMVFAFLFCFVFPSPAVTQCKSVFGTWSTGQSLLLPSSPTCHQMPYNPKMAKIRLVGTANIGQPGPGYTTLERVLGSNLLEPLYVGYYQVLKYWNKQGMVDGSASKPALRQDTGFWGLFNASFSITKQWNIGK